MKNLFFVFLFTFVSLNLTTASYADNSNNLSSTNAVIVEAEANSTADMTEKELNEKSYVENKHRQMMDKPSAKKQKHNYLFDWQFDKYPWHNAVMPEYFDEAHGIVEKPDEINYQHQKEIRKRNTAYKQAEMDNANLVSDLDEELSDMVEDHTKEMSVKSTDTIEEKN